MLIPPLNFKVVVITFWKTFILSNLLYELYMYQINTSIILPLIY